MFCQLLPGLSCLERDLETTIINLTRFGSLHFIRSKLRFKMSVPRLMSFGHHLSWISQDLGGFILNLTRFYQVQAENQDVGAQINEIWAPPSWILQGLGDFILNLTRFNQVQGQIQDAGSHVHKIWMPPSWISWNLTKFGSHHFESCQIS